MTWGQHVTKVLLNCVAIFCGSVSGAIFIVAGESTQTLAFFGIAAVCGILASGVGRDD